MPKQILGKVSIEHLAHFCCGFCKKWWSIGDPVIGSDTVWYCPWCGKQQKTKLYLDKVAEKVVK